MMEYNKVNEELAYYLVIYILSHILHEPYFWHGQTLEFSLFIILQLLRLATVQITDIDKMYVFLKVCDLLCNLLPPVPTIAFS